MAKRSRNSRAQNKIVDSSLGPVTKAEPEPVASPPAIVLRSTAQAVARAPLISAEFERVIEIIARERVYQAMLARLELRLLSTPPPATTDATLDDA